MTFLQKRPFSAFDKINVTFLFFFLRRLRRPRRFVSKAFTSWAKCICMRVITLCRLKNNNCRMACHLNTQLIFQSSKRMVLGDSNYNGPNTSFRFRRKSGVDFAVNIVQDNKKVILGIFSDAIMNIITPPVQINPLGKDLRWKVT